MDGFERDRQLLADLVEFTGLDGAKIARKIGVAASTIGRPLSGAAKTRLSQRTIEKLRNAFPRFPGWTNLAEDRRPYSPAPVMTRNFESETLSIPMLDLGYGMGATFLDNADPDIHVRQFPREFVRMFSSAPEEYLCWSHGIGDSMEPTISDRDPFLIDRSRREIFISEQIWVLAVGGLGMVKRVRVDGKKIVLASDNPNVRDYQPGDQELNIIGRVVAVVKRI